MRYIKRIVTGLRRLAKKRQVRRGMMGLLGLFVVVNAGLFLVYKDRTYPNTSVGGLHLGTVKNSALSGKLTELQLLPSEVELTGNGKSTKLSPATLGVSLDMNQMTVNTRKHSWLPVINLVKKHDIPLALSLDQEAFGKSYQQLTQTFVSVPVDAKLTLDDGVFNIKNEAEGYSLDATAAQQTILSKLSRGQTSIELSLVAIPPGRKAGDLVAGLAALKEQQSTSVTYIYQSNSKQLTPPEISRLYAQKDAAYELADGNISAFISQVGAGFGIRVQNLAAATAATKEAVANKKQQTITLVAAPPISKSYSYCTATKGVDASNLGGLEAKLASVYGDAKGWSLNGRVAMAKATSGCSFTVWLSAANLMSSFGAICDADWSCNVGSNVVINFDRWSGASTAWNQNGGTLDDYRSMVINHETGHWLGFGHVNCGGAGQLAPVMQQQSINLQGCKFNPWPLPSELAALKSKLGI